MHTDFKVKRMMKLRVERMKRRAERMELKIEKHDINSQSVQQRLEHWPAMGQRCSYGQDRASICMQMSAWAYFLEEPI